MNKEIIIPDGVKDIVAYRKVKSIIGKLGYSADTKIYIKNNDLKLIVSNQHIIDSIKKAFVENDIHSNYVEIGD